VPFTLYMLETMANRWKSAQRDANNARWL